MAINYLNTVNLNQNQLENAAIQNLTSDPAAGVLGQVYYNTAISELKICTTASTTAAVWTVVGSYDYWVLDANGQGATANITNGMTANFVGGLKITTDSTSGGTLNIVHDTQAQSDSTSTDVPGYGGTFTTVDSVTRDSTGHVTGINVKTVAIPASDNTDTTYDLTSAANTTAGVDIILTGSDTSTDAVNIVGTANEIEITQTATANKLQIGLPDDVTIGNDLTVTNNLSVTVDATITGNVQVDGEIVQTSTGNENSFSSELNMNSNKIKDLADPTSAQDAATKSYVDAATVGLLEYQGGYDANTNTPVLDSRGTQIAVEKGWTYTVTADGTFYGEVVRVGDVIIAEVDLAAGNGALTDWTTVQNNIDLASATQVGIGNVVAGTSATVTAPYSNGTATLDVVDSTASQKGAVIVAPGEAIDVSYSSGTATVSVEDSTATNKGAVIVAPGGGIDVSYSNGTATVSGEDSSATNKGIVIVSGGTGISVAYSGGTATVSATANGARQDLLSTDSNVTRTEAGGLTTFALDVGAILGSTSALDVKAEIISAAGQTVYADITRSGTTLNVIFTGSVADSAYQALLIDLA